MSISNDRLFGIHDDALRLRSQRMSVLSSNLANADTPGYKARDLKFDDALREAAGVSKGLQLARTHAGHLSLSGSATSARELYRVPEQPSLDGNTVNTEAERVKFMENSVQYQSTLSFLNSRISSINTALKGE